MAPLTIRFLKLNGVTKPVSPAPLPLNEVAVQIPVMTVPVFVVTNFVLLLYINCTASFSATKKFLLTFPLFNLIESPIILKVFVLFCIRVFVPSRYICKEPPNDALALSANSN